MKIKQRKDWDICQVASEKKEVILQVILEKREVITKGLGNSWIFTGCKLVGNISKIFKRRDNVYFTTLDIFGSKYKNFCYLFSFRMANRTDAFLSHN